MTRQYQRYNKEQLAQLIALSQSFTDVCRKLNKKPVGGTITNMKLMCDRFGIDYTHMTGSSHWRGKKAHNRRSPEQRLVMGKPTDHRVEASKLRRALFEVGIEYKCNCCGIAKWYGVPLVLEIDHIDEQYWNNTRENLQFLCPNCHSLKSKLAPLAQLAEVLDLESRGSRFESEEGHQNYVSTLRVKIGLS